MTRASSRAPYVLGGLRRRTLEQINAQARPRESLEAWFGQVWDKDELAEDFEVKGYLGSMIAVVRRRSDGQEGTLTFQIEPNLFFDFRPLEV